MQDTLKLQLVEKDSEEVASWGEDFSTGLHHLAGVDISFDRKCPSHACAMLCILSYPSLDVVHISSAMVELTEPYIPGFLAFREVDFLLELLESVTRQCPRLAPQAILVDGNGVLHPRGELRRTDEGKMEVEGREKGCEGEIGRWKDVWERG